MTEVKKIIIQDQNNLTSDERDVQMLEAAQKMFNTGPIIGEAREVLLYFSRNLMVRDLLLDSMGMDAKAREKMFLEVTKEIEAKDKEILEKRGK